MTLWISIAIILSVLVNLGLIGILIFLFIRKDKKAKDKPFVLNFMSPFSKGRFIGVEESVEKCSNGNLIIHFLPKDIDEDKMKEEDIKPIPIIVERSKYLSFPRGSASSDKSINVILPKSVQDFAPQIKQNDLIKAMIWATELRNLEKSVTNVLEEGIARRDEIYTKLGTGELSKEFIEFTEEMVKDSIKIAIDPKIKDKQTLPFNIQRPINTNE